MLKRFYHKLVDSSTRQLRAENRELRERLVHIENKENELVQRGVRIEDKERDLRERAAHIEDKINRIIRLLDSSTPTQKQKDAKKKELYGMLERIYQSEGKIIVKRGPFQGMVYPSFNSTGSSLWPKLAGVYEKELHPVIEQALKKDYKYFVDVGCAEGYYSIGFALASIKNGHKIGKVLAYDTAPIAHTLCRKMAEENHVDIELRDLCSEKTLAELDFTGGGYRKSLIMSDCEGYEREMFTEKNIQNLRNCDLIIEVHDWCQNDTPTLDYLISLFSKTHNYELIYGIDDYEKAYRYECEELRPFSLNDKYEIFKENRRRLAEWLYLTAKE